MLNIYIFTAGALHLCASWGCCPSTTQCERLLQELCGSVMICFPKPPIHFSQGSVHKCLPQSTLITIFWFSWFHSHFKILILFSPGFPLGFLHIREAKATMKAMRTFQSPTQRVQKQMKNEIPINPSESFPQRCFANSSGICHGCEIFHLPQW